MKLNILTVFMLALVSTALFGVHSAYAADVVGNESYRVSWNTAKDGQQYQLYYGQTDTHQMDSTIDGLTSLSNAVTIRSLKPCTNYTWNLKVLRGDGWSWHLLSDQHFTTGGACSAPKVGNQVKNHLGNNVNIVGTATATASWSPSTGAEGYILYYGPSEHRRENALKLSDRSGSVSVNYLNSGVTYYYTVCSIHQGKEICGAEKVLRSASGATKPVLGAESTRTPRVTKLPKVTAPKLSPKKPTSYKTNTNVKGTTTSLSYGMQNTPGRTKKGWASVTWKNDLGTAVVKYHLHYWSSDSDRHAVRDIPGQATKLDIKALNPNRTYWYRLEAVGADGKVWWIDDAKALNMN